MRATAIAKLRLAAAVLVAGMGTGLMTARAADSGGPRDPGVGAGVTHAKSLPRPAAPPAFGPDHKAKDPTFGTSILRVTGPVGSNAVHESGEAQNLAPIQHFHDPWSPSGDRFIVWADRTGTGKGPRVDLYELDRKSFAVKRVGGISKVIHAMNYNRGVHFSHKSEWILYAVDTSVTPNCIRRHSIHPTEPQEGLPPGGSEILVSDPDGIQQMTQSRDDEVFGWYADKNRVKTWVRSTGATNVLDCAGWHSFDEMQISDDGRYVFVKGHKVQGDKNAFCYSRDFKEERVYSVFGPDYFAGKHSGFGNRWVNESAEFPTYRLAVRTLDSCRPGTTPSWAFIAPEAGLGACHPSFSNAAYIYAGFFGSGRSKWPPYADEVVRIKADGSEVLRLCHAWSNFYSNSYDEIPCFASPAGDYVVFYTNWNGRDANSRHDVFIVRIGPAAGKAE